MADDVGHQERELKERNSFGRRRRMASVLDVLCLSPGRWGEWQDSASK